jgi:hypothetical protein
LMGFATVGSQRMANRSFPHDPKILGLLVSYADGRVFLRSVLGNKKNISLSMKLCIKIVYQNWVNIFDMKKKVLIIILV